MRPTPPTNPSIIAFTAVMTVAVLFVDLSLPLGVAAGVPYSVLVLLGWWYARRGQILVLAGVSTGLLLVGYLFSPPLGVHWMVVTNRLLSALAIWTTAGLLLFARWVQEGRKANEERLHLILQNAVNGIVTIGEDGIVESFNPAAERIFGFLAHEVIGKNATMLMPPDAAARHDRFIANYLRTGEARIIGVGREVEGRRKDGSRVPLDLAVSELVVEGRRIFTGLFTDITERERAQRQLVEEMERAQRYLDIAGTIIMAIDTNERVSLINKTGCELLKVSQENVVGKNWFDLFIPEEERETLRGVFHKLMRGEVEAVEYFENKVVTGGGEERMIAWHNTVLRDEHGNITGSLSSGGDVTEHRAAEAQLHQALKMETVGRLTGGVAHDFNNLLAVNVSNLELLRQRLGDDPEAGRLVDRALDAAERGAALTKRLLAFAREQKLEPKVIDLNGLVAGMMELLRRTLGNNIEVRAELEANLWPIVVDAVQMESALLNLVINARDAMGAKGGRLIIETGRRQLDAGPGTKTDEPEDGDYVHLAVRDFGEGMTPETVARAFEPFFTTKEAGEGSGLGLSMVYGFVKQSGGHASISSEPGHGTTVDLYLPRSTEEALEPAPEEDAPASAVQGKETILVVEDYRELRETVVEMLEGMGYQPVAAGDAESALEVLRGDLPISLLFSDVVLPGGMGGVELSRAARELRPQLRVLLTSGYTEKALAEGAAAGGNAGGNVEIIEKPYKLDALAEKIGSLLNHPSG